MVKGFKILFLLITLGIFVIPTFSFACNMQQSHNTNTTIKDLKITKGSHKNLKNSCNSGGCIDDCCNMDKHENGNKNKSKNDNKDCSGDCKDLTCAAAHSFGFFTAPNTNLVNISQLRITIGGSSFYYKNPIYSFGFHNIWQPPKIG